MFCNSQPGSSQAEQAINKLLRHAHFKGLSALAAKKCAAVAGAHLPASMQSKQLSGQSRFKVAWQFRLEYRAAVAALLLKGGTKPQEKIEGNLGLINFSSDGISWGANIIGASFMAQPWHAKQPSSPYSLVPRLQLASLNPLLRIRHPARKPRRENDSEYLLLNMLDQHLQINSHIRSGEIELFTERHPCYSCVAVIESFLKVHPYLKLTILYAIEGDKHVHNQPGPCSPKPACPTRLLTKYTRFVSDLPLLSAIGEQGIFSLSTGGIDQ